MMTNTGAITDNDGDVGADVGARRSWQTDAEGTRWARRFRTRKYHAPLYAGRLDARIGRKLVVLCQHVAFRLHSHTLATFRAIGSTVVRDVQPGGIHVLDDYIRAK